MKKRNLFLALVAVLLSSAAFSQITGSGYASRSLTAYTNGADNDSIYFYCNGDLGTLTATPEGGVGPYDFVWQVFDPATNGYTAVSTQNDQATSTVNNLDAGGYRVTITDANGNNAGCFRAWISQVLSNPSVNVNPIPPGCGSFTLNGQVTYGTATPFYNPPSESMPIDANTEITVCFSGNHTYASDLAFYFVGPTSCGSPTILLSPSPGICNGGDNINNLCFTTEPAPNFNVCTAATPLTGTYDSYGTGNTPINWTPLYGCDASASGWRVQIYDCVGGDVGSLTGANITFTGPGGCTGEQTIYYTTPAGYSSVINDNSCSAASASIYTVPSPTTNAIPFTNGFQWTASPTITIPGATTSLTPTINPGPQVDTNFTLTITGNGPGAACGGNVSDTELRDFQIPDNPSIEPLDGPVCIGSPSFNLIATPAGGTWSGPGIVNATTGLFNASFAGGPGTKTITYGFVSGGCNITTTIQIIVQASVNSSITNAPAIICDDATVVDLNAATAGGTWSGTGITNATTGIFDSSVSGFGEFEITYSIPNVCNGTSTVTIPVVQAGAAQLTDPGVICESEGTVFLEGSPSNGTWAGTGITNAATGEFDPAVAGSGTFSISYNFDPNGCITSNSIDVQVVASANTSIIDPGTICESFGVIDIALTNESASGTWSGTGITNPSTGTFDPSITGGGIQTVFFTVPNTCDGELSVDINVVPDEPTAINDPGVICVSSTSVTLTSNILNGVWSGNGIINGNSGEFSPAAAGIGTTTITYDPTDQCSATTTIDIVVNPDVNPTITDINPICETASPVQLQSVDAGGTWSGNGVDPNTGVFNPAAASIGANTITYSFSGACSGQDETTITVVAEPTLVLQTTSPICVSNTNYQLTAAPAGGTWSGNNVSASGVFNAQTAGVGAHTVTYTVSGVCSVSTTFNLNVVALPTVTASADDAICAGESITISASGAVSYSWSTGNQNSSTSVQPNATTTYTVTGTDANGCQNTDQVTITVNPLPIVTATVNDNSICEGEQVTLSATGLVNYNWTSSQNIQNANNSTATSTPANSAIYTVSGTDANGCSGSAQVSVGVTIITTVFSTVGGLNNELVGPVTFEIASNATSFDWDFGNGETTEGESLGNVDVSYSSPGIYEVTVTSYLGECVEIDQIQVIIDEDVVIIVPNVITINGDGLNDIYRVIGRCVDSFDMMIYNRYGTLVAEIHDYDRYKPDPLGIYGTYNNDSYDTWAPRNKLNPGTYFYHYEMVDCASRKISKTGEITVLDGK